MSQNELQKLFEANAELNSPEAQTAKAELRMCLEQQQQMTAEPLGAKLHIPYADTADFGHKLSKIEQVLQEIHSVQEAERQARIKSDKASKKRDQRTFLVAILTLIATIATVVIGVITLRSQLLPQLQNRSESTPIVSEFSVLTENP